jgi:hypothetical protein
MKVADLTRIRWLLGALLVAAAALFAIGVAAEGGHHDEAGVATGSDEHQKGNEAGEHDEAGEAAVHSEEDGEESGERLLGINLESTPLVVGAVIASIVLAAATWRTDRKWVLAVTALFATGFAALDVAEFSHQIRESAATIAIIAAVLAVLHALAAALAEQRRAAMP